MEALGDFSKFSNHKTFQVSETVLLGQLGLVFFFIINMYVIQLVKGCVHKNVQNSKYKMVLEEIL